jgi:hypothetical protein
MRVASWNILSDLDVPKHPSQANRLDEITEKIIQIRQDSARFLIYLCECVTQANVKRIATEAGLAALGKPLRYNNDDEHGIFLADELTATVAVTKDIIVDKSHSINGLTIGEFNLIACHMPYQFIKKMPERYRHTSKIIGLSPDMFIGDLNSPSFFWMRKRFERAGYTEAHINDRPIYPHPGFRGINVPSWWPDMNLDAIMHRNTVNVLAAGHSYSNASDHPIVWVDIDSPSDLLK